MELDPTIFESPMYETANEAVLHCLSYLSRDGHAASVASLCGLPPVNEAVIGRIMYQRLVALRSQVSAASKRYIDIAVDALGRALEQPELRAVA